MTQRAVNIRKKHKSEVNCGCSDSITQCILAQLIDLIVNSISYQKLSVCVSVCLCVCVLTRVAQITTVTHRDL